MLPYLQFQNKFTRKKKEHQEIRAQAENIEEKAQTERESIAGGGHDLLIGHDDADGADDVHGPNTGIGHRAALPLRHLLLLLSSPPENDLKREERKRERERTPFSQKCPLSLSFSFSTVSLFWICFH